MQDDIEVVEEWSIESFLTLRANIYMLISRKRTPSIPDKPLVDFPLQRIDAFKYLGVTIIIISRHVMVFSCAGNLLKG